MIGGLFHKDINILYSILFLSTCKSIFQGKKSKKYCATYGIEQLNFTKL